MKNKIKNPILSLLASYALASTAFACPPNSLIDSPYLSAQFGVLNKPSSQFEGKKYTGRIAYGYLWNTNEQLQLGLEGGLNLYENAHYTYLNTSLPGTTSTGTLKRVGLDILGVLDFYATSHIDIFGKVGPAVTFQKFKYASTFNQPATYHKERTALKLAVGVGYDINEKANLYLSRDFQTRHRHEPGEHPLIRANATSIGIRYKFC